MPNDFTINEVQVWTIIVALAGIIYGTWLGWMIWG